MLRNKKILILSSYPITRPVSGGQKRANAIVKHYKKIFKEVKHIGIYPAGIYESFSKNDLTVAQPDIGRDMEKRPYAIDYIVGEAIAKDIHIRSPLAKLISEYKPHIIEVEEIYPYIGLSSLLKDMNLKPVIIYSSYNVESAMKKDIYNFQKVKPKDANELVERINRYELRALRASSLTITVSTQDAKLYKEMGVKRIVVIPNGISPHNSSSKDQVEWVKLRKTEKFKKIVVFIGSGHPPNWEGFHRMIGDDFSFLPKDTKIVVAGGVSNYLENYYKSKACESFKEKVILLGQIDNLRLNALIDQADIILLPIISGGGSNLKTAEAILSNKKIVSTNYSFRGFEEYTNLPNIYLADKGSEFREELVKALGLPYIDRSSEEVKLTNKVRWDHCLEPLRVSIAKAYFLSVYRKSLRTIAMKVVSKLKNIIST